jgi:hypothetical protein
MFRVELANRAAWAEYPALGEWMATTRLDPVAANISTRLGVDQEATAHLGRYMEQFDAAQRRLDDLLTA